LIKCTNHYKIKANYILIVIKLQKSPHKLWVLTRLERFVILGPVALLLVHTSLAAVLHIHQGLLLQQADGTTGALTVTLQEAVVE
jgi:hypothetical protein